MNLLLDTHALIWALSTDPTLSPGARSARVDPNDLVFVSAVSVCVIAIKRSLGKLQVPGDVLVQLEAHRFDELPITAQHAWRAGNLPPHHADPFDRLLDAQASEKALTLVTRDGRMGPYGVTLLGA